MSDLGNIRVYNPKDSGVYQEVLLPSDVSELVILFRSTYGDSRISQAISSCVKLSIALSPFELLGGFNVKYDEDSDRWEPSLLYVYPADPARKGDLSPAMSIVVACLSAACNVTPRLDCMQDCYVSILVGERVGRFKPVVFTYKPSKEKQDVTKAVILTSPGLLTRYRGSYDIESNSYKGLDDSKLADVPKELLELGSKL